MGNESRRAGRLAIPPHPKSTLDLPIADDELTIGRSFDWSTARYAHREALVFQGRRWSYAQLAEDVERCARALTAAGVGKGTRVGVKLGNRPEFVILVYAIAKVGGISVLISTFSGPEETDWILRHSDTALLVLHRGVRGRDAVGAFLERHAQVRAQVPGAILLLELPFLRRVVVVENQGDASGPFESWEEWLALGREVGTQLVRERCADVVPTDDAILLYTSGSSSRPKGVLHVQRAPVMQSFRMADAMAIGPDDRVWSTFPMFWTAGWTTAFAGPLWAGACAVLQEFFDPGEAVELLLEERVSCIRQTVYDEIRLVEALEAAAVRLPAVTVGVVTEPLKALTSVPYEITEWCGWGMSETFTNATVLPFDAAYRLRRETMGAPVPGIRIRICDPETGEPLPAGESGEIRVAGPSVMRGYYKADPMYPGDENGFLRTGDSGYLRGDGLLVFSGRIDRLIKTAGVNVSPIEIEEHLQEWGQLGACGVTGVPHPTKGLAVVVCAVRVPGRPISEADVIAFLRSRITSYKIPQAVVFVTEGEMPVTSGGKVKVSALAELATERLLAGEVDGAWREHLSSTRVSS